MSSPHTSSREADAPMHESDSIAAVAAAPRPSGALAPVDTWFSRASLRLHTVLIGFAFTLRALARRGRGTHTLGVAARGTAKVVDASPLPANGFFVPGRVFPVRIRHATALRTDEAERDFRSMAIKFADSGLDSPLDLIMNTGHVQGFWHAANFLRGVLGGAFGERGRRWYILRHPPAWQNVIAGIRRAPSSYLRLRYYAAISFELRCDDNVRRLCRFRVVPWDGGEESGWSEGDDLQRPWFEKRLSGEQRSRDYLRREYAARLLRGEAARYRLQVQVHTCVDGESARVYDIGSAWDESHCPWHDLVELRIDSLLDAAEAERTRFRIYHQPPCLGIPEATSPNDFRSIGWMRARIYPANQRLRMQRLGLRAAFGLGLAPAWDASAKREERRWRTPACFTALIPVLRDAEGLAQALQSRGERVDQVGLGPVRSLHFLRMAVLPEAAGASRLLLDTVHDGDVATHLLGLCGAGDGWLGALLLRHCLPAAQGEALGLPTHAWTDNGSTAPSLGDSVAAAQAKAAQAETVLAMLLAHRHVSDILHLGREGGSAERLRAEARLRSALAERLDAWKTQSPPPELSPLAVQASLRAHAQALAATDSELPIGPRPRLPGIARWQRRLDMVRAVANPFGGVLRGELRAWLIRPGASATRRLAGNAALALHWLWTILPTAVFLHLVRRLERAQANDAPKPAPGAVETLQLREDHRVQNPLTMRSRVRPGRLRAWVLGVVLRGAEDATRHVWNQGQLAGIDTIHCARFLRCDDNRTLLFISDYDGSWERYLRDFLSVGQVAVMPIFTHAQGCPPTLGLRHPTPGFAARFLDFTRHDQVHTHLWYSTFPTDSLRNLLADRRVVDGLFAEFADEAAAAAWLREI